MTNVTSFRPFANDYPLKSIILEAQGLQALMFVEPNSEGVFDVLKSVSSLGIWMFLHFFLKPCTQASVMTGRFEGR